MSAIDVSDSPSPAAPTAALQRLTAWSGRHIALIAVSVAVAAGIALRLWLMARSNWMIDGDEATFGIMAEHILHGQHPIFLYNQPYMGSFQAYIGAIFFFLFGMSRVTLKLVTVPEIIVFTASVYFLARRIGGRRVAIFASILTAIPPIYVVAATARLWGPLLDAMTLGNIMLLLVIDEVYSDEPSSRPWLRFFIIGLCAGAGFWMHGQIVVYIATAGILLFLKDKRVVIQPRLLALFAGFIIGDLPVLDFARNHAYNTFDHLLGVGAKHSTQDYPAIAKFYFRENVTRVLGLKNPWAPEPRFFKVIILLLLAAALGYVIYRCRWGLLNWLRLSVRRGQPADALILFCAIMTIAFIFSTFGALALQFTTFDATGRYVIPLITAVPIIIGIGLARIDDYSRLASIGVLGIFLAFYLLGYANSDPQQVWQSDYWSHLPESNTALIAQLNRMGVTAVWINHWAGTPLMFDTNEHIAAADAYDLIVGHGIDRLPADTNRVRNAAEPAYVFTPDQFGQIAGFEQWLGQHGISYDDVTAGDYRIVRPHQKFDPAKVVQFLGYHS